MNVRQVVPRDAVPSVDDPGFRPSYDGGDDVVVLELDGAEGGRRPERVPARRPFAFARQDDHGPGACFDPE